MSELPPYVPLPLTPWWATHVRAIRLIDRLMRENREGRREAAANTTQDPRG